MPVSAILKLTDDAYPEISPVLVDKNLYSKSTFFFICGSFVKVFYAK